MSELNWKNIRYQLLKGGMAPKYIDRTIRELKEHGLDLKNKALADGVPEREAELNASMALGDEQSLVNQFLNRPELRSFTSRYPKIFYLIGPTLAALASLGLFASLLFYLGSTRTWFSTMSAGTDIAFLDKFLVEGLLFFNCYLMVPSLVIATVVFARQRMVARLWPLLGIITLTVLGSGWAYTLHWPTDAVNGALHINWGYSFLPRSIRGDHDLQNYMQIAITLLLAAVTWRLYDPWKNLRSSTTC